MAELVPEGFVVVREIGPFDAITLPRGLLSQHRLKAGRWGWLRLREGRVRLVWEDGSGDGVDLVAPASAMIPPEVPHHLELRGDVRLDLAFLAAA